MLAAIGTSIAGFFGKIWAKIALVGAGIAAAAIIYMKVKQQGKDEALTDSLVQDRKNVQEYKKIEQDVSSSTPAAIDKRLQPWYRD